MNEGSDAVAEERVGTAQEMSVWVVLLDKISGVQKDVNLLSLCGDPCSSSFFQPPPPKILPFNRHQKKEALKQQFRRMRVRTQ